MLKNIGKSKLKLINVQFPPLYRSHLLILLAIDTVVNNKKMKVKHIVIFLRKLH